jgi:GDP-mannose 6-dehydrogenase
VRISIFGIGYVGVVTGACFAREGHDVIGVDVSRDKVDLLNAGKSPIVEEGIGDLVADVVRRGKLVATLDHHDAIQRTDVSLISVGTPSRANGGLDLRAVETVAGQIGAALREKPEPHTVVIRSTLLPGTTRDRLIPVIEAASGKHRDRDLHVCYNPEFLREGSSIRDFYSAPFTILGASSARGREVVEELYRGVDAPVHHCTIEVAEAIKYVSNAFHALKVGFANEVGVVLQRLGVDSHAVMDLVCRDTVLNISPAYLRPGFAFGGSCLPKDVRAFVHVARQHDIDLPLLGNLLLSNQHHVERAVRMILDTGKRDVALLGLSFKAGTDDLRESPLVTLAERLIGKGCRLRIYDPEVVLAKLTGANRAFIDEEIPHIGDLLTDDFDLALEGADVAVVGNGKRCNLDKLAEWSRTRVVIDLQRFSKRLAAEAGAYHGICW